VNLRHVEIHFNSNRPKSGEPDLNGGSVRPVISVQQGKADHITLIVGFNQEWRQNFACQEKKLHDIVAF